MPVVPQYDSRKVTTQPIANVRESSVASPELYGASARSMQNLGRGIQQAGGAMSAIAYRIQERENADRVMQAEAGLKAAESQFHLDMKDRRGQNAWGATRDATKWWEEAERKYGENLANEAQQKAFRNIILQRKTASISLISDHEARQRRQSLLDSSKASIASSIDSAATAYDSPDAIELNRKRIASTVHTVAKLEGWDADTVEQQLSKNLTMMHKRVIQAQLEDDPFKAEEYYKKHKEDIKGADQAAIKEQIRQATTLGKAQQEADRILSKVPEASEQLAEAKKIKDPETRKTTELLVKQYQAQTKKAREDDQKAALDDAWRVIANGGDRNAISNRLWTRLSGQGQKQVVDYLQARADKELNGRKSDDYAVLDDVERKIEQGDIVDTSQLQPYEPYFRDATLRSLRSKISKRDEVKPTVLRQVFEDRLGKRRTKWNDEDREQWIAFQDYITNNVRETKRPEDVEVWADKWFMEGYGVNDRLLTNDPDTYGESVMAGRSDFVIKTPDQAKVEVQKAIEILRSAGIKAPESKLAADEFYTRHYIDAQRFLAARESAATPDRLAAYAYLRSENKPITLRNIDYIAKQLK